MFISDPKISIWEGFLNLHTSQLFDNLLPLKVSTYFTGTRKQKNTTFYKPIRYMQQPCACPVEYLVLAQCYSLWQKLPPAQELHCVLLSVNVSFHRMLLVVQFGGKNISFTFVMNPVSVGCVRHLCTKKWHLPVGSTHTCIYLSNCAVWQMSCMYSNYYYINKKNCQHIFKTWVFQTFQLSAASVFQRHRQCKAVLLIILWLYNLQHKFHFSVSRSCLASVNKKRAVSSALKMSHSWKGLVNPVINISFNIITFIIHLFCNLCFFFF